MTEATIVSVRRDSHNVHFVYDDGIDRGEHKIEWGGYGVSDVDRSSFDSLLGEKDYMSMSWSASVHRETPHRDDEFPMSMPAAIANMLVYARDGPGRGMTVEPPFEAVDMDHLHVQEEARGMGYGQLMWDVYLTVAVAIGGDARGKVGDDETANTKGYLERQGVPSSDITHRKGGGWLGSHTVIWDTDVSNIRRNAPVEVSTQVISDE